jgi:hypothetical protein
MHPHFTGYGGQYFMPVFEFYLEHGIGKGFQNGTILFNERLFRHKFRGAKIRRRFNAAKLFFNVCELVDYQLFGAKCRLLCTEGEKQLKMIKFMTIRAAVFYNTLSNNNI